MSALDDAPCAAPLGTSTRREPARKQSTPRITLANLLQHGILQAGADLLTVDHRSARYCATLLEDGRIQWDGRTFESPSAFSVACKQKLSPERRSDDGWKSVKYNGVPLEQFKEQYTGCTRVGKKRKGDEAAVVQQQGACPKRPCSPRSASEAPPQGAPVLGPPPQQQLQPHAPARAPAGPAVLSTTSVPAQLVPLDSAPGSMAHQPLVSALAMMLQGPSANAGMLCKPFYSRLNHSTGAASPSRSPPQPSLPAHMTSGGPRPLVQSSLPGLAAAAPEPGRLAPIALPHMPPPTLAPPAAAPNCTLATPPTNGRFERLPSGAPKLPMLPRKPTSIASTQPRAPKAVPSTTHVQPRVGCARSRRDVKTPGRLQGESAIGHGMMELEAYSGGPETEGYDAQPFRVRVHPLAIVTMDIHAHLCTNEVIGVLGGAYHAESRTIEVTTAKPVREGANGEIDVEMDPEDQLRAVGELEARGLQCVGWYHSHPTFPALPSSIDVVNQHAQQMAHRGDLAQGSAVPYVAAIVGPYDLQNTSAQSTITWFYVEHRRPEEAILDLTSEQNLQNMVPKQLCTALMEDAEVTQEAIMERALPLVLNYATYAERTDFRQMWRDDLTNLQKLASSVLHSVRGFLEAPELKAIGTSLISSVWERFYPAR